MGSEKSSSGRSCSGILWTLIGVGTGMVGYTIHHSVFWSIMDFIFIPLAWAKWLICHEVNVSVLKLAFGFLLE